MNEWSENGWEADYYSGHLILTNPQGDIAEVALRNEKGRNITLTQFKSSVKSHGIAKTCEVFWKLRANKEA